MSGHVVYESTSKLQQQTAYFEMSILNGIPESTVLVFELLKKLQ